MRAETAHTGLRVIMGVLGFALYWPTLRQFEFAAVLGGYTDPAQANRGTLLAVLVALAVLCVGAVLLRRRVEPLFARPSAAPAALCCVGTLGAFLLALAPGLGGVEPLAFGLGTAAVALGYVALTLAWASSLLAMDGRSALLVMVIGYAFGSLAPLTDLASQRDCPRLYPACSRWLCGGLASLPTRWRLRGSHARLLPWRSQASPATARGHDSRSSSLRDASPWALL